MTVLDADYDYAARMLISLVHEVFLVFLQDGRYFDYLVEAFDWIRTICKPWEPVPRNEFPDRLLD